MAFSLPHQTFIQAMPPHAEEGDSDEDVVIQVWDPSGIRHDLSPQRAALPQPPQLGYTTVSTDQGEWRAFSTIVREHTIQVAQRMHVRQELAATMAWHTIVPLLVLFPVLALLIWVTVGRGLRPLHHLAAAVGDRSAAALHSLPDHDLPREVRPLVRALNDLLSRLGRALETQRAFIAEAAHALRTPLTVLQLQIQLV